MEITARRAERTELISRSESCSQKTQHKLCSETMGLDQGIEPPSHPSGMAVGSGRALEGNGGEANFYDQILSSSKFEVASLDKFVRAQHMPHFAHSYKAFGSLHE